LRWSRSESCRRSALGVSLLSRKFEDDDPAIHVGRGEDIALDVLDRMDGGRAKK
jgi:hypothetical protein